jgi:hypothetical protein
MLQEFKEEDNMENKYDQLKMDLTEEPVLEDSVQAASEEAFDEAIVKGDVVQETIEPCEIISPVSEAPQKKIKSVEPQTIAIEEEYYEEVPALDDDIELISPDVNIFEKIEPRGIAPSGTGFSESIIFEDMSLKISSNCFDISFKSSSERFACLAND